MTVAASLKRLLELFGGWEACLPPPPAAILLKPNMLADFTPEENVTTHPALVRAVAKSLLAAGYRVRVGDCPAGATKGMEAVWRKTGLGAVCDALGLERVNLAAEGIVSLPARNGLTPTLELARAVLEADAVVNLPKFKTHSFTILSGGVKNCFGYIPGMRKTELHKLTLRPNDFAPIVADVYRMRPPELTIMDAVTAMHGDGPSAGRPYPAGLLVAGDNAAALDHSLARRLVPRPQELPVEAVCLRWRLFDPGTIVELGEPPRSFPGFELPGVYWTARLPRSISRWAARQVRFFPEIVRRDCRACGACARACPQHAIRRSDGGFTIDYSRCIVCLCCHEVCPVHAVRLSGTIWVRLYYAWRDLRRSLSRRETEEPSIPPPR